MAGSFNAFGSKATQIGGHTPVWLGTVAPRPKGGVIAGVSGANILIPAGTPVQLANGTITPVGYYAGSTYKKNTSATPNGYLYNDVYMADLESPVATGAVVDFHGEGLLISRVPGRDQWALETSALKTAIPNVVLIEE